MKNFRLNLRKVAMIVACLAVTTMFASCDGKNGGDDDDGNGGGKIDAKLVGTWELSEVWGSLIYYYYYTFNQDGSFVYGQTRSTQMTNASGKYAAANGKITFTNISFKRGNESPLSFTNKVFEYKIESEDGKPLLRIGYFTRMEDEDYVGEDDWRRFRRKE